MLWFKEVRIVMQWGNLSVFQKTKIPGDSINIVVAHPKYLPKENDLVNVFSVMKLNFSHFKRFSGEAVSDRIT